MSRPKVIVVSAAWPLGYEVRPSLIFSSSPEASRRNLHTQNTHKNYFKRGAQCLRC